MLRTAQLFLRELGPKTLAKLLGFGYNINMKKILAFILAVICAGVCYYYCNHLPAQQGRFDLAGTVTVPERLLPLAQADNNSCAIIVKNEADVPVAIKRVVNPKFPLPFALGEEDLLTENVGNELKLEVQINSHGQLGIIKEGDVFGSVDGFITANAKDITVEAGKTLGKVQLAKSAKGNFFRTAAR